MFRDYIPDDQLADYYRAADVFALSSRYEPFGMTAVEAMACGTPTVVTTEGGLWEQVTWGLEALYANPFDPEAFGHAIATVLQHPRVAAATGQVRLAEGPGPLHLDRRRPAVAQRDRDRRTAYRAEPLLDDVTVARAEWAINPAEEELWKTPVS